MTTGPHRTRPTCLGPVGPVGPVALTRTYTNIKMWLEAQRAQKTHPAKAGPLVADQPNQEET
jgi:hypothetical protein